MHALALSLALAVCLAPPAAQAQRKTKAKTPEVPAVCTDFHTFTNQSWLDAHLIVAGEGMESAFGELAERARQQQVDLLNDYMQSAQAGVPKLLGDFWASGLAEAAVERDGAQPIAPLLARIDAIRRGRDVPAAIAALHQVGLPVLFDFGADIDLSDLDRHVGYFTQGGLGLPDPAFYTRNDTETRALLDRYRDYVSKLLALAGTPAARLQADTQAVIDLETRIATASRPASLLGDPRASYALVPVAGLDQQYRNLKLQSFLQAQGVTDDSVSLANPQLFSQLDAMVAGLKPAQWQAYLRFHVASAAAPYLSKAWRDVDFAFRGQVLRGELAPPSRQDLVLAAINRAAGPMLGREYAARYLPEANRAMAVGIAAQVRDAFGRAIDRNSWMSDTARAEAKAKLALLRVEIGTPARDLDYTVQPMGRGSFGSNMLIASTWRHREEMRRIGRGNADRRWNVLPQQPALGYDVAQNRLIITAATLQPPVLDMARDQAANYGALGALVAHELTHAIDGEGRMVAANGQLRDWWTAADASAWDMQLAPLVVQYGGLGVDGQRTLEENAADLSGVELALDALATAQPALDDAGRQWFFQGWAKLWPQQMSPDVAARMAASDVHAPGKWRTNAVLANQAAFGSAFKCKPGTPMQREPALQVKIWD